MFISTDYLLKVIKELYNIGIQYILNFRYIIAYQILRLTSLFDLLTLTFN